MFQSISPTDESLVKDNASQVKDRIAYYVESEKEVQTNL